MRRMGYVGVKVGVRSRKRWSLIVFLRNLRK